MSRDRNDTPIIIMWLCLLWVLAIAILSGGCAKAGPVEVGHPAIIHWHQHYLDLMGVDAPHEVRYVPEGHDTHPEFCGWVGWDTYLGEHGLINKDLHVAYAPCATRDTAMHEVCHLRMQHHALSASKTHRMSEEDMELEVVECMEAYALREARARGYWRQSFALVE